MLSGNFNYMRKILWSLTIIGSILGALLLLCAVYILSAMNLSPMSAVSSIAATAVGLAVIPYCLARAANELKALKEESEYEEDGEYEE